MTAISYPTVTVINGDATWDSMNGEYGSGSAIVGDFGSEIVLDGSVEDIAINMQFIPREDWEESDFGYEFTVSITQGPPWGIVQPMCLPHITNLQVAVEMMAQIQMSLG